MKVQLVSVSLQARTLEHCLTDLLPLSQPSYAIILTVYRLSRLPDNGIASGTQVLYTYVSFHV